MGEKANHPNTERKRRCPKFTCLMFLEVGAVLGGLFCVFYFYLLGLMRFYADFFWILIVGCTVGLWYAAVVIKDCCRTAEEEPTPRSPPLTVGTAAGVCSIQGRRQHMEDTFTSDLNIDDVAFYGVFDGHGGHRASAYVAEKVFAKIVNNDTSTLLEDPKESIIRGFKQVDKEFLEMATRLDWDDGTTAVTAMIINKVLHIGNTGDSRAVLVSKGRGIPVSDDHKPNRPDEKVRIESLGGRVVHVGTWRVAGILAVARAIGDRHLKQWVIPDPEVQTRPLSQDDEYLILASDGVWDVFSNQEAADIVSKATDVKTAANQLTWGAYNRGSFDNITSLIINLSDYK